jgi:Fe-S-cluster containining protein
MRISDSCVRRAKQYLLIKTKANFLSRTMTKKTQLYTPPEAVLLENRIIARVKKLVKKGPENCLSREFITEWEGILGLFERYQSEVLNHNSRAVNCTRGCGVCCCHWPEDVYSFETKIIADHLRKTRPRELAAIINILKEDLQWLDRIKSAVNQAASSSKPGDIAHGEDPYDIVLSSFYQLGRPCPLLGNDGACTIYALRPLTCRIYVSFSPPRRCRPEYINNGRTLTYLLDIERDECELFDLLHFMYDELDGGTGFRPALLKYLGG